MPYTFGEKTQQNGRNSVFSQLDHLASFELLCALLSATVIEGV